MLAPAMICARTQHLPICHCSSYSCLNYRHGAMTLSSSTDRPWLPTWRPPLTTHVSFFEKRMNQDPDYWWPPCRDALGDGKAKQDATSACLLSPSAQLSPRPHPRPWSSIIQLPSLPLLLDLFPFPQQHCSFSFFISLVCSSFVYKEPSFHSRDQSHSLSLAQPS